MKSRVAVFAVMTAAVMLLGGVCARRLYPPEFVSFPISAYVGTTAWVRLAASGSGYDSVRYVVDWGDATIDTTGLLALAETAAAGHVWKDVGVRQVRAAVYSPDDPQGIRWGNQRAIDVVSQAPVIDAAFVPSRVGVQGAAIPFTVRAHDPDGDSLCVKFEWNATETTTAYLPSPCSVTVSHVFAQVETATVIITAYDIRGMPSLPDTIVVPIGTAGGVKWYWRSVQQGIFNTSPLCVSDGQEECASAGCYWDEKFYSLRVRDGKIHAAASPFRSPYVFTGPPAFCLPTQHFIVGSEEGELYALDLRLARAWRWPDAPAESLEPMVLFGAPAIRDNRLYVPRADDSLYYFIDSLDRGVRVATFAAGSGIVDAPVIDAQGDVYFGTGSGYLYKVGPELDTVLWRTRLVADGEIHSPIAGGEGVYCSSESSRVYAVDPATGAVLWVATTEGRPLKLAAGRTAIFFGTDLGVAYSISPASGAVNWQKPLARGRRFVTAPIVTANGYSFFQDDSDAVYCLDQADGSLVWACDCDGYLPGGGKPRQPKTGFPDYQPNPTIASNGDVIVPGVNAVFCVVGYPAGPLDPLASWPKWQHDLYNTGNTNGGR